MFFYIFKYYIFFEIYSNLFKSIFGDFFFIFLAFFQAIMFCNFIVRTRLCFLPKYCFLFSLICIVLIIGVLEIFNSNIVDTYTSLTEFKKSYSHILVIPICYVVFKYNSQELNVNFIKFLGKICIPIILFGIYQFIFPEYAYFPENKAGLWTNQLYGLQRSVSIFSGPFHFGFYCILAIPLYIFLYNLVQKKIYIFLVMLSIVGVYCSLTRVNLVCLMCCTAILFIYINNYSKILFVFLITVFTISLLLGEIPENIERLIFSVLNFDTDSRFLGRIKTWNDSLELIISHPFIGWGIGTAGDTLLNVSSIHVTPHNLFLKILVENGICCSICYLLIFFFHIYESRNKKTKFAYFFMPTLCVFINGLTGSTISCYQCMVLYWILMNLFLYIEKEN